MSSAVEVNSQTCRSKAFHARAKWADWLWKSRSMALFSSKNVFCFDPLVYNIINYAVTIFQGYYMLYRYEMNDDDVPCHMLQQKKHAPNLGRSPSLQRRSSPLNIMTSLCPVMRRSYPQNRVKSPEKKQTRQVKRLQFAVLDDFVFDLKLPFRLMEMMQFQTETLSEKEGWWDAWYFAFYLVKPE